MLYELICDDFLGEISFVFTLEASKYFLSLELIFPKIDALGSWILWGLSLEMLRKLSN